MDKALKTDITASKEILAALERLSGPPIPASLESLLAKISPRPRYLGPEAWLAVFRACADADSGDDSRTSSYGKTPLH
jgi:hypothetical protein